jgi:hypothetical protein
MSTSNDALPRSLRQAVRLAHLLDDKWRIPIIGIRFGIDPIVGLLPVVGDAISLFLAISIVVTAINEDVPRSLILRMVANVVIDFALGLIPVVGDVADFFFRPSISNILLLEAHFNAQRLPSAVDTHSQIRQ